MIEQATTFGHDVRARRRSLDLTQDELARRVGCAAITVRKIEANELRPSQQIAERLALALSVPLEERAAFVQFARSARPERMSNPPPPSPRPDEIGIEDLSGRAIRGYALGERIGTGAFGAVYRAVQPLVEREVAIKIILPQYADHPDFIRRFEAEAQLVARLEHPAIVPLYDYWREPGIAYLVMRLLRGGSLHSRLSRGLLSFAAIVQLMEQIGAGLHTAHRMGVVHRDLKPANILLDSEGNSYLADFGIAKQLSSLHGEEATRQGIFIGSPAYAAPEQIRADHVSPQTDIYALGIMLYELFTGRRPFSGQTPVELIQQHLNEPLPRPSATRDGVPAGVDRLIQRATAKIPSARYPDVPALLADLRVAFATAEAAPFLPSVPHPDASKPTLVLDLEETDNPFKGLRAFQESDAADFFGREALVQQLLARLGQGGDLSRFLAVVGPSGSGKSSVVRAGLLPALRRGGLPGSERWFIAELQPGPHPFEEIEAALLRIAVRTPTASTVLAMLREDARGLLRATRLALPDDEAVELVLVIDQFEELFTLVANEAERALLLDSLVAATLDPRSRVRIVITLRADFIDRPLHYVDFGELLRQRSEFVLPLTPEELEQAVLGPSERAGLVVEPALLRTIAHEVAAQPGALPLLQYALTELFGRRDGRLLTLAAYQALGGAAGALANRADALYDGLDDHGREVCHQLFLRLVTLGEGVEDTRRRTPVPMLAEEAQRGATEAVLATFGRERLLTFDRDPITRVPTVEVAHEALLRTWARLRGWLTSARESLRTQQELALAAADWRRHNHDQSYLAMGARLAQFTGLTFAPIRLNREEQAYLDASLAAAERAEGEERERLARELAQAQALAEEQRRRAEVAQRAEHAQQTANRRLRWLVATLALFVVAATTLSGYAFQQRAAAERSAEEREQQRVAAEANFRRAEAQRLAAEADSAADAGAPDLAALLAMRSLRLHYTPQADRTLLATASAFDQPEQIFDTGAGGLRGVAVSADGNLLAMTSEDGTAWIWPRAGGAAPLRVKHSRTVNDIDFSPNGQLFVTASNDRTAQIWETGTGRLVQTLAGHLDAVISVRFSPDGRTVLTTSKDSTARLWEVANGRELDILKSHSEITLDLAFTPDGRHVLTTNGDGTISQWAIATGVEVRRYARHNGSANDVAITPDGRYMVSGGSDGTTRIWDIRTGAEIKQFVAHGGAAITWLAISPDGTRVATSGNDGTVHISSLPQGRSIQVLPHPGDVEGVAFMPDGDHLLTGGSDGVGRLWTIRSEPDVLDVPLGGAQTVSASPDGQSIATAGSGLQLWRIPGGTLRTHLHVIGERVVGANFLPDGRLVVGRGIQTGVLELWLPDADRPAQSVSSDASLWAIAVAPGTEQVAFTSVDGQLRLWDLSSGAVRMIGPGAPQLAISANGAVVATGGSAEQPLRLYRLPDGEPIPWPTLPQGQITSLALAPDGAVLLTGSDTGELQLWDVASGRMVGQLDISGEVTRAAAFAPDGRSILTGGRMGTVQVWDRASAMVVRSIAVSAAVTSVAFSPDGRSILVADKSGVAQRWLSSMSDTLTEICGRALRDLTAEERTRYGLSAEPTCTRP
jgi:WD40 repeat protein/serine/threonine protein kinase/DNA-binding XRE family transcriptional regulator